MNDILTMHQIYLINDLAAPALILFILGVVLAVRRRARERRLKTLLWLLDGSQDGHQEEVSCDWREQL